MQEGWKNVLLEKFGSLSSILRYRATNVKQNPISNKIFKIFVYLHQTIRNSQKEMKVFVLIISLLFTVNTFSQELKWYSWEEAVELNKKEPRKFMVDVYTDWCGYCKVMDRNTFSNKHISSYLNEAYYAVKLDAEGKDSIVFKDYTYKFIPTAGRSGAHELAIALLNGQMSYPSIVFLNENIEIIHIQKGYVEPVPFDEIIKYIGGSYYLNTPYEDWKKAYVSPFTK